MARLHPFYKYYDTLFAAKDYRGEIGAVLQIYARYQKSQLKRILEIGCGTGNHTLELAKQTGVAITAIDCDRRMIDLAEKKFRQHDFKKIQLRHGKIETTPAKRFDLIVALFHVVTYLENGTALKSFFKTAALRLRPGGMLIFDCWNGLAALKDPPRGKLYKQSSADQKIVCKLTSQTNFLKQKTTLAYHFDIVDKIKNKTESATFTFAQTLWTPLQIESALKAAGLKILRVCLPFKLAEAADAKSWKIMFICQKGGNHEKN